MTKETHIQSTPVIDIKTKTVNCTAVNDPIPLNEGVYRISDTGEVTPAEAKLLQLTASIYVKSIFENEIPA